MKSHEIHHSPRLQRQAETAVLLLYTTALLQWVTLHTSVLLDSGLIKQRTMCLLQTHCEISPLIEKYWCIKLIWVWTLGDCWRLSPPILLIGPFRQSMSCWLYVAAVISAVVKMCGYSCCISKTGRCGNVHTKMDCVSKNNNVSSLIEIYMTCKSFS